MNTMNMPGFTADHSLYGATGHYRTDRNRTGINLTAQANGTIHPEATDLDTVGEEVIIIEGTAPTPWGLPSGWGPGGWGGPHGGGGPVPTGPGGGGGGGGTGPKETRKERIKKCKARCEIGLTGDLLACSFEKFPEICRSNRQNVFSRCKTRCDGLS